MNHPGRLKTGTEKITKPDAGRRKGLGDNEIKMSILFYLMDGPKWRTDIINFIKHEYHLKSTDGINRHLNDMTITQKTGLTVENVTVTITERNPNIRDLIEKYDADDGKVMYRIIPRNNPMDVVKIEYALKERDIHRMIPKDQLEKQMESDRKVMGILNDAEKEIEKFSRILNVANGIDITNENHEKVKRLMQTEYAKTIITSKIFIFPYLSGKLSRIIFPVTITYRQLEWGETIDSIERDIISPSESGITITDLKGNVIPPTKDERGDQLRLSILGELKSNGPIRSMIEKSIANNKHSLLDSMFRPHRELPSVIKIIDAIDDVLREWGLEIFTQRTGDFFGGTLITPKHLIPIREREIISRIVQVSPTALQFILSIKDIDISKSMLMFIPYCDYSEQIRNVVYYSIKDTDILNPENTPDKFASFVRNGLLKWEQSFYSPLYRIVFSMLIFDMRTRDTIENEWFWDFYKSLFNEPTGVSK
jgi:hypothetical protein